MKLNTAGNGNFPISSRLAVLAAMIAAVGILATTAYTREAPQSVGFICDSGDRFVVEFHQGHVRLRHGTGIFSLSREASEDTTFTTPAVTYTDGKLNLRTDGSVASLERTGMTPGRNCVPEGERT